MSTASAATLIASALKANLGLVRRTGPASWAGAPARGRRGLTARLEGDWLVVDARAREAERQASGPELLQWNAGLPRSVKWVWAPGIGVGLRAEIPLEPLEHLDKALEEAGTVLLDAGDFAGQRATAAAGLYLADSDAATAPEPELREAVRLLCEELGWGFHRRPGGRAAIDLNVPGESYQAWLESAGPAAGLFVEMAPALDALSPASRVAVASVLAACSWGIRGVRGVARGPQGGEAAGLETALASPPDARAVGSALACLSVASAACGREVSAVREEDIALPYLAVTLASGDLQHGSPCK